MYIRKSPLGFAIHSSEERTVLMGFPSALLTGRLWESGDEFRLYLEEQGLGLKIEQRSSPLGYYAIGNEDALNSFLDEIENHFLEE
jgi:hypothetical protein